MPRRFLSLVSLLLLLFFNGYAQDSSLVQWQANATKAGDGQYKIVLHGAAKTGWHIYTAADEDGLSGIVIEASDAAIKLANQEITSTITTIKDPIFEKDKKVAEGSIDILVSANITGTVPAAIKLLIKYEVANADNFIPEEKSLVVNLDGGVATKSQTRILIPTINLDNTVTDCRAASSGQNNTKSEGLLTLFALGFLGGLVALLTPCVFPMIPLTVSFFTKKGNNRKKGVQNAFLYGFFIFLIYVLLSVPFHFIDSLNPEILNNISTNVYLNVLFFIVFIVFALSFFGFYEITLPGSLSNSADTKAGAGNIVGIFFMALTLALVSFSCTGPILGSLLAGSLSADGGAMQLTSGMAGFGLALALPFALFALFPNWLNALPKSGGWLTTVKVVLGFVELALAFKFLSNADLVMHWGILKKRNIYWDMDNGWAWPHTLFIRMAPVQT